MVLLGEITYLFLNSARHQQYAVHQLAALAIAPIKLDQFRLYRSRKGPVGYVAWAWLSDAVAADYATGSRLLRPQELRSGPNLWFIEFLAPFGHAPRIACDLRDKIFPDKTARSMRHYGDGRPPQVRHWRGAGVADGPVAAG
jgi:cytolysin-activating lysine-acyltransferase